jgi:hypothetical protein
MGYVMGVAEREKGICGAKPFISVPRATPRLLIASIAST